MTLPFDPARTFSAQLRALLQRAASTCTMKASHWDSLAKRYGPEVYSEALYRLTRLEKTPQEARECLLGIVAHQQELCAGLGRSVSLLTATCDYFMQVDPVVRDPVLVEVRLLQQKEESAYRDELTGLLNRRSFNQELPREIERFRRFGQCFSLLILDLDHFKDFNDSYGHSAGDQALQDVARILVESARRYDRVVRYGGEEFAIILPQATDKEALTVAERIREAMLRHHVRYVGKDLGIITVSIGLACYPEDGLDMSTLVQSADKAMYQAKVLRNNVQRFRDAKRSHPRYILSDPLPVSIHSPQAGNIMAQAWDVSLGGLSCRTVLPLLPSTSLQLVLADASRAIHLPLQAQVCRLDEVGQGSYQMGLSFRLDNVEDQMKLMALMDGHLDVAVQPQGAAAAKSWS